MHATRATRASRGPLVIAPPSSPSVQENSAADKKMRQKYATLAKRKSGGGREYRGPGTYMPMSVSVLPGGLEVSLHIIYLNIYLHTQLLL